MTDIEIPLERDRKGWYRFFEILPGTLSWGMLTVPFLLNLIVVTLVFPGGGIMTITLAAPFVFIYLLINFLRGLAGASQLLRGHKTLQEHQKLPWSAMLDELESGVVAADAKRPKWHREALRLVREKPDAVMPSQTIHAIIVATVRETRETLAATIESVLASEYDTKKVIFVLAYEERAGQETADRAHELVKTYGGAFLDALAVGHPANIPSEIIGKGGNVTYAGRQLQKYLTEKGIDPIRVLVTTLDADNRPHRQYLNALSYTYAAAYDSLHASYQPVALFTNNIWDVPAPMRVLATSNSFFHTVNSLRLHALRNFSAHAQPMAALIETDFWSVRTIVEDGHHFWRCYFRFDGNYRVYPLHVPIYQDAVLADGYIKTLKAQFIQLRRWTYGVSDVAYVVSQGFFKKNKVPRLDLIAKLWRLLEGHVTWAVGPILVLAAGFVPAFFSPNNIAAQQLPILVGRIQTVATFIILITVFLAFKTLPPKPARYKRHRTVLMVLQWAYLPITTFCYNSLAAYYSQTRLMFRRYISKFDVTEKAVVTESGQRITSGKD